MSTGETPGEPAPFGAYRPNAFDSFVIWLTRLMPKKSPGKNVALALRKLAQKSIRKPVDTNVYGLQMRIRCASNISERRILFQPKAFDPIERAYMDAHLKKGDVFLDVGANVGIYSLLAAKLVGASGRVIAVEPQPNVFERLRTNMSFNPSLSIDAVETALGSSQGEAELFLNPENDGEASLTPAAGGRQSIKVPQTTLLNLLEQRGIHRVDFLKIDVEGAEELVLDPFFSHAPRALWPKAIIIERNARLWSRDLVAELLTKGYTVAANGKMNYVLALS